MITNIIIQIYVLTDDASLTLVSISDADINDIDNNSGKHIASRVRAKNEKARKKYCSQEITTFY